MNLSIHSKSPGFSVDMLSIPLKIGQEQSLFDKLFFGKLDVPEEIPISGYQISQNGIEITHYTEGGMDGLSQFFDLELFPLADAPGQIPELYISKKTFLLGTDKFGRDLLSRMLVGMRISLSIGFIAVLISLIIGITLGSIAGYFGGKVDAAIMWLINVTWSIPTLLLVIAITLALGKGYYQVFVAVGLTMWVEVARIVRGQVLGIKEMQYVTAARALGFNNFRILSRHILPNSMASVIIISAANFASAILVESGLSFLGIGAQPPVPSWGGIIKDHYAYLLMGKPFLALIPGIAIMSLVMAFMLLGNAIRDAMDVRSSN